MDPDTKSRIVNALEDSSQRPKMPCDDRDTEIRGMLAAKLIHKKHEPVNKREAKQMEKECEIVRLHQIEGMKPSAIAR